MENNRFITKDGQFGCQICKGIGEIGWPIFNPTKLEPCFVCNGSGYLVDNLKFELKSTQFQHEVTRKELKELKECITKTSKCKTCKGYSYNSAGGCGCSECGLEGSKPWGG